MNLITELIRNTIGVGISIWMAYIFGSLLGKYISKDSNIPWWMSILIGEVVVSNLFVIVSVILPSPLNSFIIIFLSFVLATISKKFNHLNLRLSYKCILLFLLLGYFFLYSQKPNYSWDDVVYHLPVIREIETGQVRFPMLKASPYMDYFRPFTVFYGNLPYASESFSALAYFLSGKSDSAPQLISFLNLLLVFSFIHFLYKYGSDNKNNSFIQRTIILILVLLYPGIISLLGTTYLDINVFVYQISSFLLLLYIWKYNKIKYLNISALFISFALGIKYTALYAYIPWLFWVFMIIKNLKIKQSLQVFLLAVLFSFIGGGFWYLKNIFLYQNPLYPLYLGHRYLTDEEYKFIYETTLLFRKTTDISKYFFDIKQMFHNYLALYISLIVIMIDFIKRKSMIYIFIFLSGLFIYTINYFSGGQVLRYVLIFPLSIIITSYLVIKNKFILYTLAVLCLISLFSNKEVINGIIHANNSIEYSFLDQKDKLESLNIGCGHDIYKLSNYLNTPKESIINFWDPITSVYYSKTETFAKNWIDESIDTIKVKYKYVYDNENYRNLFTKQLNEHRDINPEMRYSLQMKLINNKRPIFTSGVCSLYEI